MFSFKYKLSLFIACIIVALLSGAFFLMQAQIENEFRTKRIPQALEEAGVLVSELFQQRLEQLFETAYALQGNELVRSFFTDETLDKVTRDDIINEEILPGFPQVELAADGIRLGQRRVDLVVVTDGEGGILAHSDGAAGVLTKLPTTQAWRAWMEGREEAGHLFSGQLCLQFVGLPYFIGGEMRGVVVVGRMMRAKYLQSLKAMSGLDVALFDDRDLVASTAWTTAFEHGGQAGLLAEFQDRVQEAPAADTATGALATVLGGEEFLYRITRDTANRIPPYAVVQSVPAQLGFVTIIRGMMVVAGLSSMTLGLILAGYLSFGISRPIRTLQDATREIEAERYDHRVDIRTRDEFSELGASFNAMAHGLGERERIRSAFNMSVSEEIASHMLAGAIELGGETREATVLFSDIRDFSGLSEGLEERELLDLLNAYFTHLNACIRGRGGNIDKFMGDAVMALFGAPLDQTGHAVQAVLASLDMLDALRTFNRDVAANKGRVLKIGIGINTGSIVAGLMGSEDRLNYTVLGDGVNLASRLEGVTKVYSVETLITEATFDAIRESGGLGEESIVCRELDTVRVKGMTAGVKVFEVVPRGDHSPDLSAKLTRFSEARRRLDEGDFAGGVELLETLASAWPDDGPTRVMAARYARYVTEPALYDEEHQNGAFICTTK